MAPKAGKAGKKPKKTKAELEAERIQKEQEERVALEAEVKRLEEDRITAERLAREKKEHQIQYRIDELRALNEELIAEEMDVAERDELLAALERTAAAKAAWAKYIECNPRPDAASEASLNTYLSLLDDEKPSDLPEALASCEHTESIAAELSTVLENAEAKGQADAVKGMRASLQRMRDASCSKLDLASAVVLQHADEFMDEEKKEVLVTGEKAGVRIGIWVNLVLKTTRGPMKPLDFAEVGLRVDIPRALNTQLGIGARILYLPYTHIAQQYLGPAAPTAGVSLGEHGAEGGGARATR